MDQLIEDSKKPKNKSLATLKPKEILNIKIEESERDWPEKWKSYLIENDLFEENKKGNKTVIKKRHSFFSRNHTTISFKKFT